MAVTRIKNNQITDATSGNTFLGVNATSKLQDYTVTSGKIANNLTYNSNLTVTGNLTVQGNTTTIDTTITTIEDPVILLASGQTSGAPAVDIGFIGARGNLANIAFVWDESADEFVTAFTSTGETNTTITISSYADFHTNNANIGGNIVINGTTSLVGNIVGAASFTGNITAGNLLTPGQVTATGNVTGGNILTAGSITATGNIDSNAVITGGVIHATTGNIGVPFGVTTLYLGNNNPTTVYIGGDASNVYIANTNSTTRIAGNATVGGFISAGGNVIGGNVTTAGLVSATGNITGGNLLYGAGIVSGTGNVYAANFIGNISGNIDAGGSNTEVQFNDGDVLNGSPGFTFNKVGNVLTANGNINGANLFTGGTVSATGNVIAAAVNTATLASSGGITLSTTGANGNINIQPNGSGNIVLGGNTYINGVSLQPVQDNDVASKYYVDILVTTAISYHEAVVAATTGNLDAATGGTVTYNQPNGVANGVGATLTTTGTFTTIDTANVQTVGTRILVKDQANAVQNGVYVYSNATVITRASTEDTYGAATANALSINDYFFVSSGNVNAGSAWIVDAPNGVITFGTSNILFAQFSQSQVYSANTSAGLVLNGTVFSAKVDNNTTAFDGTGNIIVKAGANLTTPNIGAATGTSLSTTGTITGGNINTAGLITATGNITGGNILFGSGIVSGTGNIYGGNIISGNAVIGNIDVSGNITVNSLTSNTFVSATGNISSNANIVATANVIGGNISTAGQVTATANITGGNILTGGLISATSTITSAANITGANLLTGGLISATGTITSASDVIGANISTTGLVTATGNIYGGNLILSGAALDTTAGRLTVNSTNSDADFAVNGDTVANVFYVDAGTGTASFGSSTQVTNAVVNFSTTTSIKVPTGNTAQRPGTGVTGMVRFNTTNNNLELYDNTEWTAVGVPVFTVIADEQFAGDGSTVQFTLTNGSQTTNSCIVSINGVVQIPTLAYAVSGAGGNILTFTEAPATTDVIDVREITTTTTVNSIANGPGNAIIAVSDNTADVVMTGNVSPSANLTYSLGNTTNRWSNLWVGGNTIYLGNLQLKEASANTFAVFTADGITQANVDVGNVDVSAITTGTSVIGIYGTGQAYINVNSNANVLLASNTSVLVNGAFSATGNVVATGNVTGGNITTAGLATVTGNVIGGNITTAGLATVTGNVIGGNIRTAGLITATGNITGGNLVTAGNLTANGLTVNTDAVITGNLTVNGTTTTINSNTITTNDLQISVANNAASAAQANNGGLEVGPIGNAYITWLYNNSANTWVSSAGISAVGNISAGGNLSLVGNIVDTGPLTISTSSNGNITLAPNGTGVIVVNTDIRNGQANATGNIGATAARFNTVFALATSAQYADLAEKYAADADYAPGTVVMFGGSAEVTLCVNDGCSRVAGVISTNPSYRMNDSLQSEHTAMVALTGRVPTSVTGTVRKGDMMVSAGNGVARAEANPAVGTVIGKALADSEGDAVIEVVVGRV